MLRAYYLDQPLTDAEVAEVEKALAHPVGPRRVGTPPLEQVLVPGPWPPVSSREMASAETGDYLDLAKENLGRAGIFADRGQRVGLIVPRDQYWGPICATAILVLTGECPWVVQPWVAGDEGPARGVIQVFGLPVATRPTEGG